MPRRYNDELQRVLLKLKTYIKLIKNHHSKLRKLKLLHNINIIPNANIILIIKSYGRERGEKHNDISNLIILQSPHFSVLRFHPIKWDAHCTFHILMFLYFFIYFYPNQFISKISPMHNHCIKAKAWVLNDNMHLTLNTCETVYKGALILCKGGERR